MKQYQLFSEQDFINDPFFQEWVLKPDEAKDSFWEKFIQENPGMSETVRKAKEVLISITFREHWATGEKVDRSLNEVLNKINTPGQGRLVRIRPIYRWLSIAAILLIIVTGGYLFLRKTGTENTIARTSHTPAIETRIVPGGDRAILTLSDGRHIVLDSSENGALVNQGGVLVVKKGGELSYKEEGQSKAEVVYNTVSTPKGGEYQLILADGTKVWLNAASSLKFPTAFNGTDRTVELTGEGYFEVVHDSNRPFHVKVDDMDVRVLGTHFNINSYSDEPSVKTTLLEGRVMVKKGEKFIYLNPGQQAITNNTDNQIRIQNGVDIDETVAWKNGRFAFNSADIETIMRQAARWYDVTVHYEGKTDETFSGSPLRSADISQFLKIMEATGKVKFEIKGNQITVKPK